MKTNEKKDLQTKTVAELTKLIQDAEKEIVDLKLSHQQSKLSDTRSIFNTRKRLAVLKTLMTIKMAAEKVAEKEKSSVALAKDDKGGKKNG